MTAEKEASILELVRRLLALSSSSNQHEAALATAKAQELLLKYNLELVDVPDKERESITREFYQNDSSATWLSGLLSVVARNNFCRAIGHGSGRMAIIGEPHNIEIVKYLYDYLKGEINRLADSEWGWYDGYVTSAREWKHAFRHGAVNTINARLKATREQAQQDVNTRALVVQSDQALEAKVQELYLRIRTRNAPRVNSDGYQAGKQAGYSIGIRQGVQQGSSNKSGLLR